MGFRTHQCELAELTASAAGGRLQLPDFQRDYRRSDEQVRQLLVAVAQGHPIGSVLLVAVAGRHLPLEAVPVAGATPPADVRPELLVLDGQHRLTALSQAMTGSGEVQTEDAGPRRYFLHVPTAVARPGSLYPAVRSVPSCGKDALLDVSTRELELEHGWFPLGSIFTDDAVRWVTAYGREHDVEIWSFLSQVVAPLKSYAVPTIELDEQTTTGVLAVVFEGANRGGTRLTVFELLTARFLADRAYAEWSGAPFRLRDDWAAIRERLDDHPVLDRFGGDDFVQTVTLVATHHRPMATTARREDVLELSLVDYLVWAPRVVDALVWVADFLDGQQLHAADELPYPQQLVPLAAIRTVLGDQTTAHGTHAKVRQWFWCGVLGERYGGDVEARFALDLEEVPGWATGAATTEPDTVAGASFQESRLHTEHGRRSPAYRGAHALLMGLDDMEWVYDETFDRALYLQLKLSAHRTDPALLGVGQVDSFFVARRAALRELVAEAMGKPVSSVEEA